MDFPIIIIRASPLSFLGASGVIFLEANRIAPDLTSCFAGTLRSAASHLVLFCLPSSNKRDVRLI